MNRTLFKVCAIVTFILLPMFMPHSAYAAETCVVKATKLNNAKQIYSQQCTIPRADCDNFKGEWYCASFVMTSKTPPALTTATNQTSTDQPDTNQSSTNPSNTNQSNINQPSSNQSNSSQSNTNEVNSVQATIPTRTVTTCNRTDSDPDKDGWGWENNRSCRVDSSKIVAAPNSSSPTPVARPPSTTSNQQQSTSTGQTICKNTNSDSDGDGWGWEDNRSCKVTPQTATTVKTTSSSATIKSPEPIANTGSITAASITDLVLVTGQSNALGANTSYNASLDNPNNKVFAFTNTGWQVANLNQIWDRNWHPRNDPNTDPSNNFALHFGKRLVEKDSQRVVGFVLVTAPGAAISNWEKGGAFYNTVQEKTLDAINQLPHKSQIDGILWHQGESDGQDKQYYTDALYTLIYNLRNEAWTQSGASFICGETKIAAVNKRLNALNKDSDAKTACVAAADLSTSSDGAHFDASALRTLGKRYAEAYSNLNR